MANKILLLLIGAIMGALVSGAVRSYYAEEQLHEFKQDAVFNECGFWGIGGGFYWKSPELRVKVQPWKNLKDVK